ncbi:MAG: alpha-amylase [Phycisphaeraceae bacterium]|nr:alpha-amylase [Phycisphaeraceae bacterium]
MSQDNGVIYQSFHFYSWADPPLWQRLKSQATNLRNLGFSAVWIPPAYKAAGGPATTGYDTYDLFDLGEFPTPWHGSAVRTKYGDKEQLLAAIEAMQQAGLQVYADVVLNHKFGGCQAHEDVWAVHVASHNRNLELGDWHRRRPYTHFDFCKRGDQYSSMKWRHWHFDAVENDKCIFKIKGKQFEQHVSSENHNYDFLMGCDLDYDHPEVVGETQYWGRWFWDQTHVDGFRIDAVKHVRSFATRDWINHVRHHAGKDLFAVSEYWSDDVEELHRYLANTGGATKLFDVPLHYNFHRASTATPWESFDLRKIFDQTLTSQQPALSVAFVDNHDSQPLESLQSWVENWFKPMAYALILLRQESYPCVFEGDRRSDTYEKDKDGKRHHAQLTDHSAIIDQLLDARRRYNHGDQHDYFTHPNCIGWIRTGDAQHPGVMAVVMSNGEAGWQDMNTFRPGASFVDLTGHLSQTIVADENGWARFHCPARSFSVWVA